MNTDQLIQQLHDSLQREIKGGFDQVKEDFGHVNRRLDLIEARLDRQGGLIQSGTKFFSRLANWTEDIDKLLLDRDRRLDAMEARLAKLEASNGKA